MSFDIPQSIKVWSQFAHPILMWALLVITLYAGYLGFQIRRTRNADPELRKQLIKGKFSIRHHQISSILLALMVLGSLGAMGVTYINSGKLFVGSHLLAGLGMTGLIVTSASLTPYMQKGQDWARYSHITLNLILVGLFFWQAVTGVQIVQNVINRMTAA